MNKGKVFENQFKKSVPNDVFYRRLHDPAQSFNKTALYSWKNPYDCELFYDEHLYCLELKSTKYKSMSFESEKDSNSTAMIHYHQIEGLLDASNYDGVVAGFVLNFRNDDLNTQVTYFLSIDNFMKMISTISKKSFGISDILNYSPIRIQSEKARLYYTYDIKKFLADAIR
jgi:penicillin-binding protein-related factor A (putative recombinase)